MKRTALLSVLSLLNVSLCFPQGDAEETIRQTALQMTGISSAEDYPCGINNEAFTLQAGRENEISLVQSGIFQTGSRNQSYNLQLGNSNSLNAGQAGRSNFMSTLQAGSPGDNICDWQSEWEEQKRGKGKKPSENQDSGGGFLSGERNSMNVSQEGNRNGLLAIQKGEDNSLSAIQDGTNNFLITYQRGRNNTIEGFRQENSSEGNFTFDTIIQFGDNLEFVSKGGKKNSGENLFNQVGSNLAIELQTEFTNPLGGIEVSQSGRDMRIVIDQSYFPNPMR